MVSSEDRDGLLSEIEELQHRIHDLRRRITGQSVDPEIPKGNVPLLICRVGEEHMAFLQEGVKEVTMMCKLTPLPEAPTWISGVLNLRGLAVPVLDVLARISGHPRRPELSDMIVVAALEQRCVGLIVQEILDIQTVPSGWIQPAAVDIEYASYLLGVCYRAGTPTLLLSLPRLLGSSSLPDPQP